jgi:lipooligosaccharide transport system permease protein
MINVHAVVQVWRRNFMVWRKLALPSLLGNVVDPVMALMAFGLGLGSMLPDVGGMPYLNYLAVGAVCISAMNAPTFEALYSAFSRMHTQKTWQVIMNTPVRLREVVLGECAWAASKGLISTGAMLLMFAGFGLCVNARAPSYDFFMFYFTLVVTPMTFLSGAFFPRAQLPSWLQIIADYMPLSVVVDALRGIYARDFSALPALLMQMAVYSASGIGLAIYLTERRFKPKG